MELNAEQIIKAMECCRSYALSDCANCGYKHKGNDEIYASCVNFLVADALALIKELTKENERLRAENVDCRLGFTLLEDAFQRLEKINEQIKADTVRKMQELIYERLDISVEGYSSEEIKSDVRDMVYQIAKEMLEGTL